MCAVEVPEKDIGRYGIIQGGRDQDGSVFVTDVTEKPTDIKLVHGSRMAILGRDICQPEIMRILATLGPGAGGEIQLRDAQKKLIKQPRSDILRLLLDAAARSAARLRNE
jgi:UTP--glucose-1-phosphate uridylyltransferase